MKFSKFDEYECDKSWLTRGYADLLYGFASNTNGPILEIGCWLGRSLAVLAEGSKNSGQLVYGIDPYQLCDLPYGQAAVAEYPLINECLPVCLYKLQGWGLLDRVVPIVSTSSKARGIVASMRWGFIHIDGDHRYPNVVEDISVVKDHVDIGGVIAFHDSGEGTCWPDVNEAIDEFLVTDNRYAELYLQNIDQPFRFIERRR